MILFGMLLLWFSEIGPSWMPIIGGVSFIPLWSGLVFGIVGVVLLLVEER